MRSRSVSERDLSPTFSGSSAAAQTPVLGADLAFVSRALEIVSSQFYIYYSPSKSRSSLVRTYPDFHLLLLQSLSIKVGIWAPAYATASIRKQKLARG